MQLSGLQAIGAGAKAPVVRVAWTPAGALPRLSHATPATQFSQVAWAPCAAPTRQPAARHEVVASAATADAPTKSTPLYTAEYQAAVDAVKLASHLCQVRRQPLGHVPAGGPSLWSSTSSSTCVPLPPSPRSQAVQTQLKRGEASEKDDSSPVTVADYGAQALVAWSLLRSFPGQPISLVAEEDSADLR